MASSLSTIAPGTLYVGVTNDIARRTWEHREGLIAGFTKRYALKLLVYVEQFQRISDAIHRKRLTLEPDGTRGKNPTLM